MFTNKLYNNQIVHKFSLYKLTKLMFYRRKADFIKAIFTTVT